MTAGISLCIVDVMFVRTYPGWSEYVVTPVPGKVLEKEKNLNFKDNLQLITGTESLPFIPERMVKIPFSRLPNSFACKMR